MKQIILGKANGKNIGFDLDILLRTRLLVQANSGGGKSWLLRRLAEQLCSHVPVIILDPEGEFASLREKFNFVLVGKGGETPTDCRSAAMLAHKLLELRTSAVIDLYELKPSERHHYVKLFLDATIDAPKKLWRPTVYIGDEWHNFCPEKGSGESEASEASIAMSTRGRKRGFCFVPATQRLGKLRKDFAAELLNVLIGPTFIDIDRKRAAECLGITGADYRAFSTQMQVLEPVLFFALGRAICKERTLFKVGDVQTTHPEAGSALRDYEPPPPPAKIKGLLPKLADLPQQAEEKAQTERELRVEIRALKGELVQAKRAQPKPTPAAPAPKPAKLKVIEVPILDKKHIDGLIISTDDVMAGLGQLKKFILEGLKQSDQARHEIAVRLQAQSMTNPAPVPYKAPVVSQSRPIVPSKPEFVSSPSPGTDSSDVSKGERKLLTAIAQGMGSSRTQLTLVTTFARSTRDRYLQMLAAKQLIFSIGEGFRATDAGMAVLGNNFQPLPVGRELIDHWLRELPEGEKNVFKVLVDLNGADTSRDKITEITGYARSTRDRYLQMLAARCLVEPTREGVKAAENLFES